MGHKPGAQYKYSARPVFLFEPHQPEPCNYKPDLRNKGTAGPAGTPDILRFGIDANRKPLELIVDYAIQQALIPRRYAFEELFDDATRGLN